MGMEIGSCASKCIGGICMGMASRLSGLRWKVSLHGRPGYEIGREDRQIWLQSCGLHKKIDQMWLRK